MKESNKIHMGLRSFLFVALGILLLPNVNGQDPPVDDEKPCIFYAFSESEEYYFLIQNNSKLFGSEIQIITNCEYLQVNLEGQFFARSNNSMFVDIGQGYHNLTIITNEQTRNFTIEIYPDRLEWEGEYTRLFEIPETELISIDVSNSRENWASILSIVVVWVLTVYVYWKLIESYVNKNFIEEVVK